MDLKTLQLEILEAERLIERNTTIMRQHLQMEAQAAELSRLRDAVAPDTSAEADHER